MIDLSRYSEAKPKRLRRIIWCLLNATLFPLLPNIGRCVLLRCFGATIGKSLIHRTVRIYAPWHLSVGDFSCIGPHVELYCKAPISVGHHSVISQGAYLCTASHDPTSPIMALTSAPISLGNGCWVAARAALLPGVTLGDGAIVGLGSVLTHSLPPRTIAAGNPAKPIRQRIIKEMP